MAGKEVAAPDEPTKYYAVAKGIETGIFHNWTEVEERIKGSKDPKYKRCENEAECVAFILAKGSAEAIEGLRKSGHIEYDDSASAADDDDGEEREEFQVVGDEDETGDEAEEEAVSRLSVQATPGADTSPAAGLRPSSSGSKPWHVIYTDGASRGNGKASARAGYGVFFGEGDPRNLAERLQGLPQTNQRAELTAIQRALEVVPKNDHVEIFTDSQYSLNCVSVWATKWEKSDWVTSQGQPVMNQDIIKAVRAKVDERARAGAKTAFQWVKAHAKSKGNIAADALAGKGVTASLPSGRA